MGYTVIQGDVLEVTKRFDDNTFDAMLSDFPYGLTFMGKKWDKGVPSVECCKEIFRVLKPGAFCMVFGGTRTWHRLACALEDAGFEMRNTALELGGEFQPIFWLYGSGFPKSYDISKGIDKAAGVEREVVGKEKGYKAHIGGNQPHNREFNLTLPATPEAQAWQGYGTALKPSWEPILLIRKPLEPVTSKELRGLTGWDFWHNPTEVKNTIKQRLKILKRYGERLPSGWLEVKVTKISRKALHEGVESDVLFTVEASKQWRGNLTPAELLARVDVKKYRAWRTTANTADALKHGCGGLNIDGSRIPTNWDTDPTRRGWQGCTSTGFPLPNNNQRTTEIKKTMSTQGRWPANLILGGEEVAAMLDEQSGELKSGGVPNRKYKRKDSKECGAKIYGNYKGGWRGTPFAANSGGASRFYYCAKASAAERNAGLEGFEEKQRKDQSAWAAVCNICGCRHVLNGKPTCGHDNFRWEQCKPTRNHHPTVKPLALCRYLATLLLPPARSPSEDGGSRKLFVPFAGSGSEMIGGLQAGWDEVTGVEIDPDYRKIAEARIKYWLKQEKAKMPLFASKGEVINE